MTDEKLSWWKLMWKNSFIQLFVVLAIFLGIEFLCRDDFYSENGFYVGISIPIISMIMIVYGAFYKFWKGYLEDKKKQNNK